MLLKKEQEGIIQISFNNMIVDSVNFESNNLTHEKIIEPGGNQ